MALYTTGELARLAGVTVRTVQYYDSKDLLKPSELSDGGRRLYTENDLILLKTIIFLKGLDFSLNDIAAILHEGDSSRILELLICDQKNKLRSRMNDDSRRLERLQELEKQFSHMSTMSISSIGAIASIMGNRKKLRNMRIGLTIVGLIMDVIWIGTLVHGILSGVWWPFAIGFALTIVLGLIASMFYAHHIAYICPEDHTVFRPPLRKIFFAYHTPSTRKLTCPICGFRGLCLEVYAPNFQPENVNGTLIWSEGGDLA